MLDNDWKPLNKGNRNMKYDLEPAKTLLRAFLKDIEDVKPLEKLVSQPQPALSFTIKDKMPEFDASEFNFDEEDSYWLKEDSYIWLYADAREYRSFMHRPPPNPIPEYYSQLAFPVYQQWRQQEKEVFHRSCEQIPSPTEKICLGDYLKELALLASEGNEHRDVWIESLRCFLQFLREDTDLEQKGPLEILFPSQESCKGMELRKGCELKFEEGVSNEVERRYILRRIEETVLPIDIFAASDILKHLAKTVLEGRPNSQRSAAEALGFAWLCHAVGCYRLVTREELVFSTELGNFRQPNQTKAWFKPTHFLGVPSLYGTIDVPISKTLYAFLLALPRHPESNRIFSMDLDVVARALREKGVQLSKRAQNLGKITFLTFMSQPHHAIGHRSSLVTSRSKSRK
jgi:hypothetical protein